MASSAQPRQLALALSHAESLSRDDFLEGEENAAALSLISCWPNWPNPVMLIAGPEGCGKSHLAAIWAEASGARMMAGSMLEPELVPSSLATGALVVEDIDRGVDERALFHLLNLARQDDAFVLLTSRVAAPSSMLSLRDLVSRLRAVPVVEVTPPGDALLRSLIVKLSADRQMSIDEALIGYVSARIERSFAAARQAVDLLDREGLRRGRPVTRALAVELMRDAGS